MERWRIEKIQKWWEWKKWPIGANYVTSDAVNDVEMWMNSTFNPPLIEKELKMARRIGMNSVRVFLSYIVWRKEGPTFERNFETFLRLAHEQGITVMPVLFDDCAFDFGAEPTYGPQPAPVPGVSNSRWVPSPGFIIQDSPEQLEACKEYVDSIIGLHREDDRILVWDLYNEPGNTGRKEKCLPLLSRAFQWARALNPSQPLTAGVWNYAENEEVNMFQFEQSDVISLHVYTPLARTKELIDLAKAYERPILVTEWLHRPAGNLIKDHLPLFHAEKIGAWQWGLVLGRTQTNLAWETMNGGLPDPHPVLWQHDILYPDGTPYRQEEIDIIRSYASVER